MDVANFNNSLETLEAQKGRWAQMPVLRRLEYLESVMQGYARLAARQVDASNRAKQVSAGSPAAGEEWAHPYLILRTLRMLRDSLRQIAEHGKPVFSRSRTRTRRNGQLAAQVFPLSLPDRILYPGFRGEVWMQPGVTAENLEENMGAFYRQGQSAGGVALVLGAGNVAAIGPTDLLQKLFVEGRVCLFKHNPVNEYLAPFLEEAFSKLIRDGFVRTCTGGAEVGEYLCGHPLVDEIHLTGSDRTYEAIMFGAGTEGTDRKRRNQPRLAKRVTAELGNVTPVIVVPGPWSERDIQFHAENIATQVANNCGFNCLSARVLVTHGGWAGSDKLLAAIRAQLKALPQRVAYYPGAERRYQEVLAAHPQAEPLGPRRDEVIPYTLIHEIDPHEKGDSCFATECFMPVLAQTALPGLNAAEYLRSAVDFCNDSLWGTLCANIIIHPRTAQELGARLEDAIGELRYGTIAINQWVAMGYAWGATSWGAYPGSTPANIQSGVGTVHNSFMFDKPEKSVVYGPFQMWPKPPWFATHRGMGQVFSRATELEARPSLLKALSVALASVRG